MRKCIFAKIVGFREEILKQEATFPNFFFQCFFVKFGGNQGQKKALLIEKAKAFV